MPNPPAIHASRPSLPPLDELLPYLEQIWASKWVSNGGPMHDRLEQALCQYLDVPYLSLFANGTLATIAALQLLDLHGEVITTPFSFASTAHSVLWNSLVPVFVDVDPHTFNLDPQKIKAAITSRTTAIMPVHCFGVPCDVLQIKAIALEFGLKIIYDAAHAFGVGLGDSNLFQQGDLSVLSFHATKVFNTFEGGAIVCRDAAMKQKMDAFKNNGLEDDSVKMAPALNGKMSEFNAALGLLQLEYIDANIAARGKVNAAYRDLLNGQAGIICPPRLKATRDNFAYFPVLVGEDYPLARDQLLVRLKAEGIMARRYFYPLISDEPVFQQRTSAQGTHLPVASRLAAQVLCLPIYPELALEDVGRIVQIIRNP